MATGDIDRVDPILDYLRRSGSGAELDAKAVTMRLGRAAHWVDVQVKRQLAPLGIELWELDVLATLLRLGGDVSIGRLQDAAQVTPAAITNRIGRLEENGYVVRSIDPIDRRQIMVSLTDSGRERATVVIEANDHAQRDALTGVDPATLRRLAKDLRTFLIVTEGPDAP